MMLCGLIELLIRILWACLLIKWFMEKHVIYLLNWNIKLLGLLKILTMISSLQVKRGYLTLAHLMNGEPRLMIMPSCLKKKSNDGMTRGSKRENSKWVNMFYYIILILGSLQVNFFPNGKDHISSKKFIIPG